MPWCQRWSGGVAVITSASHAEGREFDPRPDLRVLGLIHWTVIKWRTSARWAGFAQLHNGNFITNMSQTRQLRAKYIISILHTVVGTVVLLL